MKFLKKEDLTRFLDFLIKNYELIAPVMKKELIVYEKVTNHKSIVLKGQPYYSLKKYFFPSKEELMVFEGDSVRQLVKRKKMVIFGARKCDYNALMVMDKMFIDEYEDIYYRTKREDNIIIGLECDESCTNGFCQDMELQDSGYDLLLSPTKNGFMVKSASFSGEVLMNHPFFKEKEELVEVHIKANKSIDSKKIIPFESKVWKKNAEKCLSCASCTSICPTCGCFDLTDETSMQLKQGIRSRLWDSCQLLDFTRVAGGHVFRNEREDRMKHRILHKLKYFRERYDRFMCTGCGRCITVCPAGIDMTEMVNKL